MIKARTLVGSWWQLVAAGVVGVQVGRRQRYIAAGLGRGGNESYPDLFQPFGGFPDGVRVENGHITMPDPVGIGFEGKVNLYGEMRALSGQ